MTMKRFLAGDEADADAEAAAAEAAPPALAPLAVSSVRMDCSKFWTMAGVKT